MTFAHPGLLGLAALAGLPALIHWLTGRWAPEEPWAAVRFLVADGAARRRAALRDRLALAARTLALLLAAVAAAGPRAAAVGSVAAAPAVLHIVVLDDTLSTARPRGGGTTFETLRRDAAALTDAAGPTDRFVLLRMAGAGTEASSPPVGPVPAGGLPRRRRRRRPAGRRGQRRRRARAGRRSERRTV